MYKKINFLFLLTFIPAIFFAGCNKGPADGKISPINEIGFSGIQDIYPVNLGDTFSIKPVLTFTKDNKNYSYEWVLLIDGGDALDTTILATTPDLRTSITKLIPGLYRCYYRVKDLTTGVIWAKSFQFEISTPVAKGWMVLSEVAGGSRLDMVSLSGTTYMPVYDVLAFMKSSLKLTGAPISVVCMAPYSGANTSGAQSESYIIMISTTGNGSTTIDPETFDWKITNQLAYRMLTPDIPTNFLADTIVPTSNTNWGYGSSFVYKDGDVYNCAFGYGAYGAPINYLDGVRFQASRFQTRSVLFDVTGRRFLSVGQQFPYSTQFPAGSSTLFDYSNVGKDLIYMTQTFYNNTTGIPVDGEVWAILKDPAASNYFLARMNALMMTQTYYKPMNATDISNASRFAVSPDYGFLFYIVGNKIYKYNFSNDQSTLMQDYGTRTITYLDCQPFFINTSGEPLDEQRKLIVGSYDPALPEGGNGTLDFYTVGPVNTPLVLESSYSGFGKIKSVAYRQRP